MFISIEKYTSISIQKYTNLICFTTSREAFLGYPRKASREVRIFAESNLIFGLLLLFLLIGTIRHSY